MPENGLLRAGYSDNDIVSSLAGGLSDIGSLFGQWLFVGFWLSLVVLIAGAAFMIILNIKHARDCDIQDSQETKTADLLRELAPAAQRYSVVDGRAVPFEGAVPDVNDEIPVDEESAAVPEPDEAARSPISIAVNPPDDTSAGSVTITEGEISDERLKYAPPMAKSGD